MLTDRDFDLDAAGFPADDEPANATGWKGTEPEPLRVVTAAEFLAIGFSPRNNLLAPWLPEAGLTMIHSLRGGGKTFFQLFVAVAVAGGGEFLRWRAPAPRRVLILDGEMPGPTMQERCARVIASSAVSLTGDFLRLVTPDLQDGAMPDLATRSGQARVEPYLADVDLVIVDNVSALCRSGEENAGESWLVVQDWALRLRRQGIAVLFVHHSGKAGQQRGTSRREDVLDTVIALRRPSDYRASEGARFEVHFEKSRGFTGKDAEPFEAQMVEQDGRLTWAMKSLDDRTTERVAALLTGGMSQRATAKELGIGVSTANRHAKKARALGLVRDDD